MPTPASPTMVTSLGFAPATVARYAPSNRSNSCSRPTNARRSPWTPRGRIKERARTRRRHGTPSGLPLASTAIGWSNSNAPLVAAAVRSPTRTSPGSAACSSRAATLTASPVNELPSRGWPTTTSLVFTPMRRARDPANVDSNLRCIDSAAWRARSAWSSYAAGAPNAAITASPANFSTVPPASVISAAMAS